MRRYLFLVILCSIAGKVFSLSQDSIKLLAKEAVKAFTWDIEKAEKGSLMFLDVAYQRDNSDSVEYLTLTVAKDKLKVVRILYRLLSRIMLSNLMAFL